MSGYSQDANPVEVAIGLALVAAFVVFVVLVPAPVLDGLSWIVGQGMRALIVGIWASVAVGLVLGFVGWLTR